MRWSRFTLLVGVVAAALLAVAGIALAANSSKKMVSTELGPRLCETVGGGKFVDIPEFPGERIDQRLLTDLAFLETKYHVFVTDALSMDPVHAAGGEHPIGLAADLVPNKAAGGTWNDIDRLAAWAEPVQNEPRAPFRWVGYTGDEGHGRGNHLHLSWDHSDTKPGIPAATVDTIFCPTAATTVPTAPPPPPPTGAPQPTGFQGGGGGGGHHHGGHGTTGTQTTPSSSASSTSGGGISHGGNGTGGIAGRAAAAPPILGPVGPGFNDR